MECERVLVAAPKYLEARGEPTEPQELIGKKHDCLMLRYSGAREYVWTLQTPTGPQKFEVHGPYDTDDGGGVKGWGRSGRGSITKPRFGVGPFIRARRLKVILTSTPPKPVQFAAVYPHKKLQDPKVRLLLDFMAERCQRLINDLLAGR